MQFLFLKFQQTLQMLGCLYHYYRLKYQQDIQLGGWVSGLRTKKKAYDKAGGDAANEWALGNEEGGAEGPPPLNPGITSKYLTAERVRRLDEIGFAWSMAKPKAKPKSWYERLSDLQEYYQENGNFKVPRNCGLGEWVLGHTGRGFSCTKTKMPIRICS